VSGARRQLRHETLRPAPRPERRPPQRRRTQAERSEDTVERLIAATTACLCRDGYGATSVAEIAEAAGVSRGALQHHFDTKADLLFGVFERFSAMLVRAVSEVPGGGGMGPRVAGLVDGLWALFAAPDYAAMLEILVGSRSDPQLRRRVRARRDADNEAMLEAMALLFPEAPPASLRGTLAYATATLRGLALYREFVSDEPFYAESVALLKVALGTRLPGC